MTLKILLAGFSALSATALTTLLQRNYPQVECLMLERCFSDDLRLMLPKIGNDADDAYGIIINLEGVGMNTFNPNHIKSLIHFIDFRVTLLLARNNLSQWRQADFLPASHGLFLQTPYNKEIMEATLAEFIRLASDLQSSPSESAVSHDKLRIHAAKYLGATETDPTEDGSHHAKGSLVTSQASIENTPKDDFLQTLVNTCFSGVCQNNVMYDLIDVFSNRQPFKVNAGTQTAYIHPNRAVALTTNLDRLLDYFSVAGNCQVLKTNIVTQTIDDNEFNQVLDNLNNEGYKRHSLNTFLWQLYSVILPAKINVPKNNLKLKMKYMPDLGSMQDTPEYIHAIISSCLITPKNVDELEEMFADTVKNHPTILQRIFLLSILSDLADIGILKKSFYEMQESKATPKSDAGESASSNKDEEEFAFAQTETTSEVVPNKSVVQAAKTGFFKRLLSKLSF